MMSEADLGTGTVAPMCGITGVLDPARRQHASDLGAIVARMADAMVPRGPDGSGTWVDEEAGVAFGHRRLSILDLTDAGAQPMASADGRWILTYNGEIYDHEDLARDLDAAGVARRGHSDTEILVEAIARWGVRPTLERLDGMFAFAAWDRRERRLVLARDRMGEKPLYLGALGSGEVVFGSTLDAIRRHPDFDRPVDLDALSLYLRHKYVPAPLSIYRGIHKVPPGCTVEVRSDGSVGAPEQYWSFLDLVSQGPLDMDPTASVEELDRLLRRSVRRRLVADVPVGAFLSGGIDSSTVVAVAQQESSTPVRTFTIGSNRSDFDESSDAKAVAAHLGTEHTELMVTEADALAVVEDLGAMYDEPFGDSSQIPTRLVSGLARRDVTVVLSGDGGDELFAGYNRHVWVPAIWSRAGRLPIGVRRALAGAGRSVPPVWWDRAATVLPAGRRPRQLGLKVAKVASVIDAPDEHDVYLRLLSHWQDPDAVVRRGHEPVTALTDRSAWPTTEGIVEHMTAMDAVTYLPDDILVKLDRATMSVSLEGRIPLLDRSIVELAARMPVSLKLRDGVSKWPLRQVLARYVPTSLTDRPKSGFGLPIEEWLRGPLSGWAEERLFSDTSREFFEQEPLRLQWDLHRSGRRNAAYELWDVLMFVEWSEARR